MTTTVHSCLAGLLATAAVLAGCAATQAPPPAGPERREFALAVTQSNHLVRFNAARPDRMLSRKPISGLQPGEQLLGIDFRFKNDTLYALGSSGRLYTIDTETAAVAAVGAPFAVALQGGEFGFDFNPVVDRIRVVSGSGQNLRLHPDTGAAVDANPDAPGVQTDGALAFAAGDANAGKAPRVTAAAYTYNKDDPKITTNFALDAASASLVTQGSREGVQPAVSPNSGRLLTVGPLQAGTFDDAAFDIHVISDAAFAALTARGERTSRWVEIDLKTGRARLIGRIAADEPVRAVALESW